MLIRVANPLYDVVFKGLMQDLDAAKTLISSILEMKVLDLEFKPQEYNSEVELFSIYRIDFKAKVELEDGSELIVLIELQKIKFFNQTFRFRRYIGNQYANKDNMKGNEAIPIITIYILGHHLQVHPDVPIIRVKRQYLVHGSEEVLKEKEPFIEGITHDAIVIQIPAIKKKKGKKTELEKVLSVFDVAMMRYVEFDDSEFPVSHYSILKRLMYISQDVETQRQMDVEDDFLDELRIREETQEELRMKLEQEKKRAEEKEKLLEQERKRAEQEKRRAEEKEKLLEEERKRAEEEKKRAEEEKKRAEVEKKKAEEERKRAEEEKKKVEEKEMLLEQERKRTEEKEKLLEQEKKRAEEEHSKLIETARFLKSLNVDLKTIANKTGLSKQEIEEL